ncbi:hypothetical protein [Mesorhizobium sp. WSM3882]|uniref:hypothetical protein n=1 Tax=Mesorhizobium sp. WSM3882 TaxID=2029407 RepID=UPI000BAF04F5|nr:hypothetical protein [Mesorhizobium sp. WSM3882]PBB32752.1 hypothetical protein CK214_11435 [Mesorhizobium sp. WSM3882]
MRLVDVIRAQKSNVSIGAWQEGKIPPSAWPLTTSSLHLGRGYSWRIVKFDALGKKFRVLIAFSAEKETYRAVLAVEEPKHLKVVCHHELHTDHWNWHCHFSAGPIEEIFAGVWRDKDTFRAWPRFRINECSVAFDVTKESALSVAARRYRFEAQGELI